MGTSSGISVIIVNYNSGELLRACLAAIQRQTLKPEQIIVVDNASTDNSAEVVKASHPDILFIQLGNNIGFAAANNRAVAEVATGEWIALLNPDAFPEPDWLQHLTRSARENRDFTFFESRLLQANSPDRLDGTGDIYHVCGMAWRRDNGLAEANHRQTAEEVFGPCAAGAMYHRRQFLDSGGFDRTFFCYFEDVDLAFRLRLAGHRCLYVPEAVVCHVGSATTGRHSDFAVYHGHRNLVWTYIKNMPGWLFWRYLPQHLCFNLMSLIWFSLRGKAGIIMKAKVHALKALPRVWRERQRIQALRVMNPEGLRQVMATGWLKPYRRNTG